MRRSALLSLLFVLSCAPPPSKPIATLPSGPTFSPPPTATRLDAGCGTTAIYQGDVPDSLNVAAGNNAPRGLPYAIAHPAIAAAFLFGYPLHMTGASETANKILWVTATPRGGDL